MLTALSFALIIALVAVVWVVVLVDDDMLLAPVQKALRNWHRRWWLSRHPPEEMGVLALNRSEQEYYATGSNLDKQWWWKPIWGCERCCAGNWATWGIPLLLWLRTEDMQQFIAAYDPITHLFIICASIYLAAILTKIYQWTQAN